MSGDSLTGALPAGRVTFPALVAAEDYDDRIRARLRDLVTELDALSRQVRPLVDAHQREARRALLAHARHLIEEARSASQP